MIYQLKFWEAVSYILAGVLALLALFGIIPAEYALGAGAILAVILSILRFFGIDPQFRKRLW